MSQKTSITFRVSGDESAPQGMSPSLEEYLKSGDNIVDRLQKGPQGSVERLAKLKDQLEQLSGTVAGSNGQSGKTQS